MNKVGHLDSQVISDCLLSNRGEQAGWIQFGMKGSFYTADVEILRVKPTLIMITLLLISCAKLITKTQNGQINGKQINIANIKKQCFLDPSPKVKEIKAKINK